MSTESALLIATLTAAPSADELARLAATVDVLEVRADLTGDLDPAALRAGFPGRLLYTLRSRAEGGREPGAGEERWARLVRAGRDYDLVDLEAARDLLPRVLGAVPAERRILSWHGTASEPDDLWQLFRLMEPEGARYYKLVPAAAKTGDGLVPLAFLKSAGRRDVIAFASGAAGGWSRLLAPRLGAPVIYGSAGAEAAAPGQLSCERLRIDYGLPELPPVRRLYGIAGNPVRHSLSPRLYNRMFRERGIEAVYLPFHVDTFGDFWLDVVESGSFEVLGFKLMGLSVTAPFKEIALAVSGATSPLAERIGSANTLTLRNGVWEAETTDPEGLLGPLRDLGLELAGRRSSVIGAGGAGRAAAFALARSGARVTLVNRSVERGKRVAAELGVAFQPLDTLDAGAFELLVNATPMGRGDRDPLPFDPARLGDGAVVVDLAYVPGAATRLVREVRAADRRVVDGRAVLLAQAIPQSLIMTGEQLSAAQIRDLVDGE